MTNPLPTDESLDQLKQALLALQKMRAKLEVAERSRTEPIAVVGLGCRFPGGGSSPHAFWEMLRQGVDAVTEIPSHRWDVNAYYDPDPLAPGKMNTRWGAFLEEVDHFDAAFFGISPREAARIDPQQRLLLEVAWEALEEAGLVPDQLAGSATGVFIGVYGSDYAGLQFADDIGIDLYTATGTAHNILAGRLSYLLDLQGPTIALDTACSSSLVSVHLACQSLRNKECNLALAGGVNLLLSPKPLIAYSKMQLLAPDGRCKTFDARADGLVLGEGCGLVVLKRLSDALADHDPIHALIRGSAINQDGRTSGITAPNALAQQAVLRRALKEAGVQPSQVSYVETHGTGTALGDPIEVEALREVIGSARNANNVCVLGSVKTNLGHLGAAAGIAGLIKAILALEHQLIPAHLHFQELNPHISLENVPFQIPTTLRPWRAGPEKRFASVSSLGWSGTNACVVVEEAPTVPNESEEADFQHLPHWLPLSARSPKALEALAFAYRHFLTDDELAAPVPLADMVYTASVRRGHHAYRLSVVGHSKAEITDRLSAFLAGEVRFGLASGVRQTEARRKLVFVFPGQGSQWLGMGRQLLEHDPVFRTTLEQCDRAIRAHVSWSLLAELTATEERSRFQEIDVIQPVLFAIQVSLAALWRSWGVVPDAVIGHSLGEIAAAYVAGSLSLEDAVRIICCRSQRLKRLSGQGAMALVELSVEQAHQALAGYEDRVSVAVSNSPISTVLSGDPAALSEILAVLEQQGVFSRRINVDVASHSPQMDFLHDDLLRDLTSLQPRAASIPMYSTVTTHPVAGLEFNAAYWVRNLRQPVLFSATVQRMIEEGHDLFVEISPHPSLLPALEQNLQALGQGGRVLASLRREAEQEALLDSLGVLYTLGQPVNFAKLYPRGGRTVRLPSYPWQRERFWAEAASSRPVIQGQVLLDQPPSIKEPLPEDWLYELQWHLSARGAGAGKVQPPASALWIIFTDRSGLGEALAAQAHQRGVQCLLVGWGETFKQLNEMRYWINPTQPEDMRKILECALETGRPIAGVAHLWSLDIPSTDQTTPTSLMEAQVLGCLSALHLIQEIERRRWREAPRVWLVTQNAQAVPQTPCLAIAQTPLWGFARTLAHESPALWGGAVDLDSENSFEAWAKALWEEIINPEGEDQIAFRDGQRYVARLARRALNSRSLFACRPDGSYLLTGGLGGLGLRVAHWLVEHGARRIILMSRASLPPRTDWTHVDPNTPLAHQINAIRKLESLGASVHLVSVDVSDELQLASFLEQYRREGWPPLRGVMHLAGELRDGTLAQLNAEAFMAVMQPKVLGSWFLYQLLRDAPLDFFVLFSSAAAVLGPPGQANHAAANAFLDMLAHYCRSQGCPALSVNWGAWSEAGAATQPENKTNLAQRGILSMAPDQALALLEQVLHQELPQVGIMRVAWEQWHGSRSEAASRLTSALLSPDNVAYSMPSAQPIISREMLLVLEDEERRRRMESYLCQEIARTLRLAPAQVEAQRPLNTLGMDSLLALELRNRINRDLGLTVSIVSFLRGVSLAELTSELLKQLAGVDSSLSRATAGGLPPLLPGPHTTPAPVSAEQERLWLLEQVRPGDPALHIPNALRLTGRLNETVLQRSLNAIAKRQASLRTRFVEMDGVPVQVIAPRMSFALPLVDLQNLEEPEREAQAQRLATEAVRGPFDLENGPLLRTLLIRLQAKEHLLIVTTHHLISDLESTHLLIEELIQFYSAFSAGETPALPSLPVQFIDFTRWQRAWPENVLEPQLAYWRNQLADMPTSPLLPTDRPRPAIPSNAGAHGYFKIPSPLRQQLEAVSRQNGATLFMTLAAAIKILLYHCSQRTEVALGFPNRGRQPPELEALIGFFAYPSVLRSNLAGNPTFQEVLRRVQQSALEAYAHSEVSFPQLVKLSRPKRLPRSAPLIEVMFGFVRAPAEIIELPGLSLRPIEVESGAVDFDLFITLLDRGSTLQALFGYNTDLFDAETIEQMMASYLKVLERCASHPETKLSHFNLSEGLQAWVAARAGEIKSPAS